MLPGSRAVIQTVMATQLSFEQVSKRFGDITVLDAVSFAVERGEIFGFLGPNGAGKTTAIHIAMGFLQPSAGKGQMLGHPFRRSRVARERVGYVPDMPTFFAGSCMDAVMLAARLNGRGQRNERPGLRVRAAELLRWMDLPLAGKRDARKLSRGQQQRLALVQALVTEPELLILDEPTASLDPPTIILVRQALEKARAAGAAVFFSSHQLQEVEQLCDRALFLDQGRVLHSGSMTSLLRESAMARITLRGLNAGGAFVQNRKDALRADVRGRSRGDLVFQVAVPEQRAFIEQAWLAGAEIVGIERERRTLEDLFAQHRIVQTQAQVQPQSQEHGGGK